MGMNAIFMLHMTDMICLGVSKQNWMTINRMQSFAINWTECIKFQQDWKLNKINRILPAWLYFWHPSALVWACSCSRQWLSWVIRAIVSVQSFPHWWRDQQTHTRWWSLSFFIGINWGWAQFSWSAHGGQIFQFHKSCLWAASNF